MNCFSGTATCVFQVSHYDFLSLSKNKIEIKTAFPFQTTVIGNGNVVPLGRCGPLWVMIFSTVFVSY